MLQQGQVFEYGGIEFVVDFVNDCRAHCIPLTANKVAIFKDRFTDKEKVWEQKVPMNISPNSCVEIKRSLKNYVSKDRYVIAPPVQPKESHGPKKPRKTATPRRRARAH